MAIHTLMIKTHEVTRLKYLCYTRRTGEDYATYLGSGTLWRRHLKKHGAAITTEKIFETDNLAAFKELALAKSKELDVVNSTQWANLKHEEGDGGDTASGKVWITDGTKDRLHLKVAELPTGWTKGRSKCVFNERDKQGEFSKRRDVANRRIASLKMWADGKLDHRDHSKCGTSGEANPSKRLEVRKMISDSAKSESHERSERMKKVKPWLKSSRNSKKKESHVTDICSQN